MKIYLGRRYYLERRNSEWVVLHRIRDQVYGKWPSEKWGNLPSDIRKEALVQRSLASATINGQRG